ncbi:MAG: hypothetical protein QM733_00015 [Ilumatobacteraceae bacterium]
MPPGTEYPLVDGGPATSTETGEPAVAALTRVLRVADQPEVVVPATLRYSGGRQPVAWRCQSLLGVAWCVDSRDDRPTISMMYSDDDRVAGSGLWIWSNVPVGAAYVTYDDGDQHLWQRPVVGVVMFPNVPGDGEVAVAHDADGGELGRVDRATIALAGTVPLEQADLSQAQRESLVALTRSTMRTCLTDHDGPSPTAVTRRCSPTGWTSSRCGRTASTAPPPRCAPPSRRCTPASSTPGRSPVRPWTETTVVETTVA